MSNFQQITNTKLEEVKTKLDGLPASISSFDTHESKTSAQHLSEIKNASVRGINNLGGVGDGSENHCSVALGYDRSGGQGRALLVDGSGRLSVDINSGIPTKTSGSTGHTTPTGVGLIGFDGSTANAVHCDSNGVLRVQNSATVNVSPANTSNGQHASQANTFAVQLYGRTAIADETTALPVKVDSSGHMQTDIVNTANVKFEDISSSLNSGTANDPANSLAVGLRARQTITDSSTETFLKCDASGVLQVSSSGGGGGTSTYTLEQQSASTGAIQIIGDGNGNQYIDTNGGSKFVVVVQTGDGSGSPEISVEWSDNTSFSTNQVFVCNGFSSGIALISSFPLQATSRVDFSTLTTQGILFYDTIPARYARITVRQTSGSAITYTAKTTLSP